MKAIRIHAYGHSDQLKMENIEIPTLQRNQLLVKVFDVGINPVDWKIREGYMQTIIPVHFPMTLGQDFAGQVFEVGADVTRYEKGDRVYGFAHGAYAEYVAVDESTIAKIPASMEFATAASIPTAGQTAYQMINLAKLSKQSTVLIHGGAGGVGSFAVQLAVHHGNKVVATASGSDFEYVKELGATEVIDFKTEKFEDKVNDVDAVIDLVGGETLKRSFAVVKSGGIIVSSVGPIDQKLAAEKKIQAVQFMMRQNSEDLFEMAKLFDSGTLKVHIEKKFPFEETQKALDTLQKGPVKGKFIVEIRH